MRVHWGIMALERTGLLMKRAYERVAYGDLGVGCANSFELRPLAALVSASNLLAHERRPVRDGPSFISGR